VLLATARPCGSSSEYYCSERLLQCIPQFASRHRLEPMSQWMTATFLGTSSGGGPTESRNCSSLVLDVVGDGSLWSIFFPFIQ
jgi:hypothetical protein